METKVENTKSTVEELRSIRDKISLEIQDMTFEQLKEYLDKRDRLIPERTSKNTKIPAPNNNNFIPIKEA